MSRRRSRFPFTLALALALLSTGCATTTLPEPGPEDCQIRAGAALAEGTAAAATFGNIAADTQAGAVTVYGNCAAHPNLAVIARTPNSTVCYADPAVCAEAIRNAPVTVPRVQFEAMVRAAGGRVDDFEVPPPGSRP